MQKERYNNIRSTSTSICEPLANEDHVVQPVIFVSPPKWHLAHTTWFFEQFVLGPYMKDYKAYNENYNYLFNSYYESIGARVLRTDRGNMTRPGTEEILKYRAYVDNAMTEFLDSEVPSKVKELIELGLNHEQQHQELLYTDIKYILGHNPLFPSYKETSHTPAAPVRNASYIEIEDDIYPIGHEGEGFCFDNERGPHRVFLHAFRFMDRLTTNGEFMEFMDAGGYKDPLLWLGEGWEWVNRGHISSPLYWHKIDNEWWNYTLSGLKKVDPSLPVTHISFYEADAFARWKKKRLLTEFEWEVACKRHQPIIPQQSNFMQNGTYHPSVASQHYQLLGDAWEWTNSAYLPYPFYKQEKGALGEYNGKFMVNQMVLRGGSCVTPKDHIRITYRNFFHPDERWQFTGIRLAESIE